MALDAPALLEAAAPLGALAPLVTPEGVELAAPLVGAGVVTDAPVLGDVAAASLGDVVAAPLDDGLVTDAPVLLGDVLLGDVLLGDVLLGDEALGDEALGDEALGDEALGDMLLGEEALGDVLLGADVVVLGIVVLDPVLLGAACFAAAVSAIAPFDVLVVAPLLDFFDVSLGVVCCAAAGSDSAVSRTAASAYRCVMRVSPARCFGVCRLYSTDSQFITAQTMHTWRRNVNFSRENCGQ